MKKILLMLALMLPCLGVMAQQELPTNCEVSFTNVQQNGTTYTLYINEDKQLALSTKSVEDLGEDAFFYIEKRPKNKYSLYNKKHKLYMIWRGKGSGYKSDKGVLADYNSTYCDWSFSDGGVINETQTYFFASKRGDGSTDGTLVVMNTGIFDAYGNTKGWAGNYSNLYTIKVEKTYDYLPEYALLQDAYNEAMANDVGEAVGMYKETTNLQNAKMWVEEVLTNIRNGESESDSETLQRILDWFKAAFEEATVQMAPGYYYVKGTGKGNNANWYLSHKININNGKECMWAIAPTGKLNADYIWKFETCEDGYKMQCVNIGKYFQMKTATNGGDNNTYLTQTYEQGNKMSLENTGSGKFIIKNSANQNVRTENGDATGAQVNYWSGEETETWYLIPATELEINISTAGLATTHLPFDVVLPENLTAYSVSAINMAEGSTIGYASLEDKKSIPANQGAILKGEQGSYTLKIETATDSWEGNMLEGSNVNTIVKGEAYVLGNKSQGVALYLAVLDKNAEGGNGNTHFLNNANKAYLPVAEGTSLVLRFNFGGTTAIESVLNNSTDANAPIYDLTGRRVMNTVKGGIYIQNGKKFIVK